MPQHFAVFVKAPFEKDTCWNRGTKMTKVVAGQQAPNLILNFEIMFENNFALIQPVLITILSVCKQQKMR